MVRLPPEARATGEPTMVVTTATDVVAFASFSSPVLLGDDDLITESEQRMWNEEWTWSRAEQSEGNAGKVYPYPPPYE